MDSALERNRLLALENCCERYGLKVDIEGAGSGVIVCNSSGKYVYWLNTREVNELLDDIQIEQKILEIIFSY